MLIVGSRAAKHHFDDFREPRDWDVICYPHEFENFKELNPDLIKFIVKKHAKKYILRKNKLQIEFEIAIQGSSGESLLKTIDSGNCCLNLDRFHNDYFPVPFKDKIWYANPEILYLLKKSHIGYQIHWFKNIEDYSFLKSRLTQADFFTIVLKEFSKLRSKEMKARFPRRKKIDLNVNNSEFFNKSEKSVKRKYPHDLLHQYTCYYDRPLYEKIKVDKDMASVNKKLWDKLTHEDKVKAVREEAFAIALERKIIPAKEKNEKWDRVEAFKWALMRISTNLTKGFFQEFALNNYLEIIRDIPNFDQMFFSKIDLAV